MRYEDHETHFNRVKPKSFKQDAGEAAFLHGGIGTGNISITPRGELTDWEIFNRPAKGNKVPYSFFCIWAKTENGIPAAKVLESTIQPPYAQARGYHSGRVAGLPRFTSSEMSVAFPFTNIAFQDDDLPLKVSMETFTPFIPLDADDSGIPGVIFRFLVENTGNETVEATIAGSFPNLVGFDGYDLFENMKPHHGAEIEYIDAGNYRGINFTSATLQPHQFGYGSMALITSDRDITVKPIWLDGGWWDGIQDFWNDFSGDGKLEMESKSSAVKSTFAPEGLKVGSLGIYKTLKPGEKAIFEFILTWYFPNRVKSWNEDDCKFDSGIVRNYYGTLFKNAWHVGEYLVNNLERLERDSRSFTNALYGSTFPAYIIDALASNITVLRSNTCFRIENGALLAYEGCHDSHGSCEGTCTHVWNYAQTMAFLFPELEKSARINEFNRETDGEGNMSFRTWQVFGKERWKGPPAADGQMGTIVRLYREWKFSGDDEFLKSVWNNVAQALNFAFDFWDTDNDFVLDGKQHNTYDIEFYGPNSLTNTMFFAALKAGAEMAEYLGDVDRAMKYRTAFEKGSKKMDELLFNGEYYIQKLDDIDKYRYQYGPGCLSDQLLGQTLAHVTGLGYILPDEHVKSAIKSVFKYNFKDNIRNHQSVQRTYALNDEAGLLLCTWPKGGRPKLPFVYSDEIWTGIEYQVATQLIYEGFIKEGLSVAKAVRDRQDGYKRNPWDEVECGHHYARALASWGLLTALSGYRFDMVKKEIEFSPVICKENFAAFFSTGKAWGTFSQVFDKKDKKFIYDVKVLHGDLSGVAIKANGEKIK